MGSHYKKSMFDGHVQTCLLEWADKVKKKKAQKARDESGPSAEGCPLGSSISVNGRKDLPWNGGVFSWYFDPCHLDVSCKT